jgi:protease-4
MRMMPGPGAPVAETKNRLILWIVAIGGLIFMSTIAAVIILFTIGPDFDETEGQWLHIRVSSSITEVSGSGSLFEGPADQPPLTTELSASIRAASNDDAIAGVYLDIRSLSMGWAQVQEVRSALDYLREQGKDCIAWANDYDNKSYYVATACSEVHLAPAGLPMVHGISVTQMYFKGLFDELQIKPNFEHVGEFKSAVEPYLREGPSDAAQEATDLLLDDLYAQLIRGIANGRGISVEDAEALIQNPPITPEEALERGMIDGLSWHDQMEAMVIPGKLTPYKPYLEERRSDWESGDGTIAVIYAEGTIIDGKSTEDFTGGQYIGDRTLRSQLKRARKNDDIDAIVLRVNSPGGSGSASDAIWREVEIAAAEKPVVISMGDYAASGGYYISMGAHWIVAQPGTVTGSIGVFGGKLNLGGLLSKFGITTHTTQRGPYSNLLSSTSDFTPEQREKFRSFLQSFYDRFLAQAAEGRGMQIDEIHAVAQGRVWTGTQALDRGLVDELGGLEAAIAKASELAGLESPSIQRIPERKSFFDALLSGMDDPDMAQAMQSLGLDEDSLAPLIQLQFVTASGGPIVLLPGYLKLH